MFIESHRLLGDPIQQAVIEEAQGAGRDLQTDEMAQLRAPVGQGPEPSDKQR
jgi:hypothetical protein